MSRVSLGQPGQAGESAPSRTPKPLPPRSRRGHPSSTTGQARARIVHGTILRKPERTGATNLSDGYSGSGPRSPRYFFALRQQGGRSSEASAADADTAVADAVTGHWSLQTSSPVSG